MCAMLLTCLDLKIGPKELKKSQQGSGDQQNSFTCHYYSTVRSMETVVGCPVIVRLINDFDFDIMCFD